MGPWTATGSPNHDEIRLWANHVTPGKMSANIYDGAGQRGGLIPGARSVTAGDRQSDPLDGDRVPGTAQQLLEHPRLNTSVTLARNGAVDAAERQGGANLTYAAALPTTPRTSPIRRRETCGSTTCRRPTRCAWAEQKPEPPTCGTRSQEARDGSRIVNVAVVVTTGVNAHGLTLTYESAGRLEPLPHAPPPRSGLGVIAG
jgi:hypothetical protein